MIRIFLIGYMGAGKTTLGKAVAQECGLSFVDLDWYIEERFHKTISELFTEKGELGFRELESNMLKEVGDFENVVISTGGGAPCFFDNMDFMNQKGTTVFLNVHPDILFKRLSAATQSRPILQGKQEKELYDFIVKKLKERASFYEQAKHLFDGSKLEDRWQLADSVQQLKELLKLT
ncbi:MAG: shikimate kinase [Bacteroides sp.]|nr:shikimate kinase [Bacteroides sp.]